MQIKRFIVDFLVGFAPALLILIPAFIVEQLVEPPYNLIGWAIILAIASVPILRRWANTRASAGRTRHSSGHAASRLS